MKVFFDTNIYIAEAVAHGLAEQLIEVTRAANWKICVSRYVADELERVMTNQLCAPRWLARAARRQCLKRGSLAREAVSRHGVPDDPKDGPILRAAICAKVDYLVTNDKHLLALDPYEGLRIISLRDYKALLVDRGLASETL